MSNFNLASNNHIENQIVEEQNSLEKQIMIATSIAPKGLEKQQAAIQSWLNLGFTVVSLNTQKEIDILQTEFKDVTFALVERHAKDIYGKPFVYVSDVLKYLSQYGTSVCGIVNSDIILRTDKNFLQFLFHEGKNSTLISSRIDIDESTSETGEFYHYGFDLFFFDRKFLARYPKSDVYCLGIPWWDYWVPLIAKQKSLNLKLIQNTVVYHVKHKINYSIDNWRKVGITFAKVYDAKLGGKLKELYDSEQLEELDKQLGDNITYNLIQMFFKTSTLVMYEPKKYLTNYSEPLSKTEKTFQKLEPIAIETKHKRSTDKNGLNNNHKAETLSDRYTTFVFYAWHLYVLKQFEQMAIYLFESIEYRNDYNSPSQFILDWIEKFDRYSTHYNLKFDADLFSSLDEWQKLCSKLISVYESVELKTFELSHF